jgi:hypothetical protein
MSVSCINLLTQLPKEVACMLLVEWVKLKDLCKLDSAYCTKSLRDIFLEVLSSDLLIYEDMPIHYMTKVAPFITWSAHRGVHVNTADLSSNIRHAILQRFLQNCTTKNLKCIALHDFSADSKIFSALARTRPQLKDLICHSCQLGKSLHFMLKGLSELRALSIERCKSIKNSQFKSVTCGELRTLSIIDSEVNNSALAAAVLMAPSLAKIVLSKSYGFTADGLVTAITPMCANLRVLGLHEVNHGVDDASIVALAPLCPLLEVVDFGHCEQLTNASILALSTHCRQLQRLYLHHNNNYTDDAMIAVALNCDRLIALHVSHCFSITMQSVCRVLEQCHRLDTLYIGGRRSVSQDELIWLFARCGRLTYKLSLSVPMVTDDALFAVSKHCRDLQHIDLHCCSGYGERGMMALARGCTKLQNVVISETSHQRVVTPLAMQLWEHMRPGLEISIEPAELGYDILS